MSEAILDWSVIMPTIQSHLEAVTDLDGVPLFRGVYEGPIIGLPLGGPYANFQYIGRMDAKSAGGNQMTLGTVMYAARIYVGCFWVRQVERATLALFDQQMAKADTDIRRAFRGDSTINSDVTDLDITDSTTSPGRFFEGPNPGVMYNALEFELHLDNLEGEPRTA